MKQLRLSAGELGALCLSLTHLFHAGIGVGDSFALLAEDESSPPHRALLTAMAAMADEGLPLSQIFREAGPFPPYVCGLLEVGERVGRTEETLSALASYYEDRARLEHRLRSALLYPAVLLLVLLAVVAVLLIWVLPIFNDVYLQLGSRLTGVAGGLLTMGAALRKGLPLLCALLAALLLLLLSATLSPALRDRLLAGWRARFGDRGAARQINEARFAQAMAMALLSGLTAQEAVALSAALAKHDPGFDARCTACLDRLDAGDSLTAALRASTLLPPAQCRLLEAGMRSGAGGEVMAAIAGRLLTDSGEAVELRLGRLEPALVVVMSLLVGLILLSVMLPLTNIMTAMG